MEHRLSPRESRRLVKQLLRRDAPPPVTALFAAAPPLADGPASAQPPPPCRTGPYETQYPICDGYTTERTIIVP